MSAVDSVENKEAHQTPGLNVLVLGVGNMLLTDEGVGGRVAAVMAGECV